MSPSCWNEQQIKSMLPTITFRFMLHTIAVRRFNDFIMSAMASQIIGVSIVYSTVCLKKFRVTGLYHRNSPMTGRFPSQRASKAENVSIWWRNNDHVKRLRGYPRSQSISWHDSILLVLSDHEGNAFFLFFGWYVHRMIRQIKIGLP